MIKIACKHDFEYHNLVFILDYDNNNQLYIGSTDFTDVVPNIMLSPSALGTQIYYSRILEVREVLHLQNGELYYNVTFETVNASAAFYPNMMHIIHIPETLSIKISPKKDIHRYKYIHKLGYFYKMYIDSIESLTYIKSAEADLPISQRLINNKIPYCLWILYKLEQLDIIKFIFEIIGELISIDFNSYKEIHYLPDSSEEECFNSDYF